MIYFIWAMERYPVEDYEVFSVGDATVECLPSLFKTYIVQQHIKKASRPGKVVLVDPEILFHPDNEPGFSLPREWYKYVPAQYAPDRKLYPSGCGDPSALSMWMYTLLLEELR